MTREPMTDSNWHDFEKWLRSLSLEDVKRAHRTAQHELLEAIRCPERHADAD